MHKYLRAIGFSKLDGKGQLKELLTGVVTNSTTRAYTTNREEVLLGEFTRDFADRIGVAVCGTFDEDNNDHFVYEYYFPYLKGSGITTCEDVSVERHASQESYAGVCDDVKVGVSLIFYLQNMIPYVKAQARGLLPIKGTSLTLSGLSLGGTILFPIRKSERQVRKIEKDALNRNKLLAAAREGDEKAIETLTLEDMDIYSNISKRIQSDDILTLVDTYCMPYGVECDQYSILGEIRSVEKVTNSMTEEEVYILGLYCNEITFDVCINAADVYGEPEVGRRFRGVIWLQGAINYPEEL